MIRDTLLGTFIILALALALVSLWNSDWFKNRLTDVICKQVALTEGATTATRIYPDRFYLGGSIYGDVGMCSKGPYVQTIKVYPRTQRPITVDGEPVEDAVAVYIQARDTPDRYFFKHTWDYLKDEDER